MKETNCIICEVAVENWVDAYPDNSSVVHPLDGTVFRTYGNYGSTVFDPMDASYLEIVLCNSCLKDRLQYTYEGINEEYKKELEDKQKYIECLLESKTVIDPD